jgi:PIN domain nuclease of toxin-antitoxin system
VALLLDTVALIRGFAEPERLPIALVAQLREAGARSDVFVSVASLWEVAMKSALGKITAPADLPHRVAQHPDFTLLPITPDHAWRVRTLPLFADHKDPFNRLIAAQALAENLTLVSPEPHFARYGVPVVW